MADVSRLRYEFRQLHEAGCFVIPNPWDPGSARYLRHLGFKALATTSAGFAFSRGLPDANWAVPRDSALAHIGDIVAAVDLPVNADFESGYAHDPEGVARNVRLCLETGVSGLSIEDATGDRTSPLYDLPLAAERIRAARAAIDSSETGALLTARTECYLVGHPDPFRESVARLEAYAEAGADVLFTPGVSAPGDIKTLVSALNPKPVNVLVSSNMGLSVSALADIGVRRISVGSSLSRVAWHGFMQAAMAIAKDGSFAGFDGVVSWTELNGFFRDDLNDRV
jgi:2-methylisocitrate lyase-like PEP mutase family enzyme